MSQTPVIDLLCFSSEKISQVDKTFREAIAVSYSVPGFNQAVNDYLISTDSEWTLFWDYSQGIPDVELLHSLTNRPVDVFHAGLKFGLKGKPAVLDFTQPLWMYNKDASIEVEHSSFRMSFKAVLVRTSVLKLCFYSAGYSSIDMAGLAIGYKILKEGGIIRYHPHLVRQRYAEPVISLPDEWLFVREYFPMKWQIWTLLNKKGFLTDLLHWRRAKGVGWNKVKPILHSSKEMVGAARSATVSVLAPTLNRYSYLMNELDQLSAQTVLPYEVLITDQTDKKDRITPDFSKFDKLNIRFFPQNENGQCIAWNKLLAEAKGEFVLFLGDDADDIKPYFIEKLLSTQKQFDADIVAANVTEAGITYSVPNEHYYLSDTFPIALVRRELLMRVGMFDMFFNKNIRADHDVAMRCHLSGALMIFDSSATIFHHRAPVGGLRTHNARVISGAMAKKSVHKFLNPTSSEIYLAKKYYTPLQVRSYIRIKYLNQLFISGSPFKKLLRFFLFVLSLPSFYKSYKKNEAIATEALTAKKFGHTNVSIVSG